jgi:DNA processing protein
VTVVCRGEPTYPSRLVDDGAAPAVLFAAGSLAAAEGGVQVAITGTRASSGAGEELAAAMGADLRAAGVTVVSGLAPGIEAAAQRGGPTGAPGRDVAVVGVLAHPAAGRRWQQQRAATGRGVVLCELPPGGPAARWRFAARQRILVGLADLVVVVESHDPAVENLPAVAAARRRGVPLAAVPGPQRAAASAGTNALVAAGHAHAVRDAGDVLALVGAGPASRARTSRSGTPAPVLPPELARIFARLGPAPVPLDELAGPGEAALGRTALLLHRLAALGLAVDEHGWWRRREPGRDRHPSGRQTAGRVVATAAGRLR